MLDILSIELCAHCSAGHGLLSSFGRRNMEKSHVGGHVEKTMVEIFNDKHISKFTPAEQKKIMHRVDRRLISLGAPRTMSA